MTTIVWDGKILAADSRTTSLETNTTGHEVMCGHCGKPSHRVRDKSMKIHNGFKGITFRNDPILAVAGSGARTQIGLIIDLIRAGENLEEVYRILYKTQAVRSLSDYRLIIVTTTSVYTLEPTSTRLIIECQPRDQHVTIGTGKMAALYVLATQPKATAIDAVKGAILVDKHSGGEVSWIDCSANDTAAKIQKGDLATAKKPVKSDKVSRQPTVKKTR